MKMIKIERKTPVCSLFDVHIRMFLTADRGGC